MNTRLSIIYFAALLVSAAVVGFVGFREIQFHDVTIAQVGALVAALAVVAIVIERAVDVYVAKRYDPEKATVQRPLERARAKLQKADQHLSNERERRQTLSREPTQRENDDLRQLTEAADRAREEFDAADERTWHPLSKVRTQKLRAAALLSLLFGALAAVSGVRILGQFLPENAWILSDGTPQSYQLIIFRIVDTSLTALLLAGGADAFHKLLSSLKSFRSSAAP